MTLKYVMIITASYDKILEISAGMGEAVVNKCVQDGCGMSAKVENKVVYYYKRDHNIQQTHHLMDQDFLHHKST